MQTQTASLFHSGDPLVAFEDARAETERVRVFAAPREIVAAHRLEEVTRAFEAVREGVRRGLYAAGWLSYEAGLALEERLATRARRRDAGRFPLLWFGLFDAPAMITQAEWLRALPDGDGAWLSPPRPRVTRAAYDAAFARAHEYIVAGDIYQINLSYRAELSLIGHPLGVYARLRAAGRGGWSAVVDTGATQLLSTSPELFFRLDGRSLEAKPMKGTAKRDADPRRDALAAENLRRDPKELAENVMIVDLLRNDMSRLATRGSVRVPELFTVETYPTLHTLTSTLRAEIKDEFDAVDVLRTLFPCGSITGAPKIRAMEIVDELETDARGPYTGSIGWIAPDGTAEFNVAIRTVAIADGVAELGLGSAVVADSTADGEWEECRLKGAFATAGAQSFHLIETMRVESDGALPRLDSHLARLARSALALGFAYDEAATRAAIAAQARPGVLRLTLACDGTLALESKPLPSFPAGGASVALAPLSVAAHDFRLRHKTTLRDFYDNARACAAADEVVFVDAQGFVTEGSFTNVFVARDGVLLTPPEARGLLPGVLRAELLANGSAREEDLRPVDLEQGFFIGNAVRGLVRARLRGMHRSSA